MPALPPLPRAQPAKIEPTLRALRAHYLEMPGRSLTAAQARRLCDLTDLDLAKCHWLFERLVEERFLHRSPDGRYRKAA